MRIQAKNLTHVACLLLVAAALGAADGPANVVGTWKMTFQKKDGGQSFKTLTLRQNGDVLEGTMKDEGGELAISGKIEKDKLHLEGHHGVTVRLEATLDKQNSDRMSGTLDVLSIHRTWTAERQK